MSEAAVQTVWPRWGQRGTAGMYERENRRGEQNQADGLRHQPRHPETQHCKQEEKRAISSPGNTHSIHNTQRRAARPRPIRCGKNCHTITSPSSIRPIKSWIIVIVPSGNFP